MKFDVVTFGSAFHDVYITSDEFKLQKSDEGVLLCEGYGKKVIVKERVATTGGGATNAAVCLERLGLRTAIVACLGTGHWGRMVKSQLKDEGVSLLYLQSVIDKPTSSSIALVGRDGGRTVLVHRAASDCLSWHHVDWKRLNAQWAFVTSLGGDLDFLAKLTRWTREKGVKLAFNPGRKEIKKRSAVKKLLKYVAVLIMNRQELCEFLEVGVNDEISSEQILALQANIIMITDGKKGCRVYTQDGKEFFQKATPVKPVEETGAGDSFGSTFVAGLIKGMSIPDCLQMAAFNASEVVQAIGPKNGLLFWPEMKKRMKKAQ